MPLEREVCKHCGSLVLAHLIASCWVLERDHMEAEKVAREKRRLFGIEEVQRDA